MEVKSIYPIINFSDEDEIAVQYERLGADGVIIISPDFSDEAMLIKKIRNEQSIADAKEQAEKVKAESTEKQEEHSEEASQERNQEQNPEGENSSGNE